MRLRPHITLNTNSITFKSNHTYTQTAVQTYFLFVQQKSTQSAHFHRSHCICTENNTWGWHYDLILHQTPISPPNSSTHTCRSRRLLQTYKLFVQAVNMTPFHTSNEGKRKAIIAIVLHSVAWGWDYDIILHPTPMTPSNSNMHKDLLAVRSGPTRHRSIIHSMRNNVKLSLPLLYIWRTYEGEITPPNCIEYLYNRA